MNVAFDPWIPVVTASGKPDLASLSAVLAEGEKYVDLAVRPHERVALMRLFICVAHAALEGPKDYFEWCEVPKKLPEASEKYLRHWEDSFDLFHKEKPWLQVADLKLLPTEDGKIPDSDKEWISLNRICFTKASGINTTLFDQASNGAKPTEYSEEEIALNLLTFQNFFVAGGKASSRRWGKIDMLNPPNPKGGPCSGKSIIYGFLRGGTLAETIHLNLSSFEDLKLVYGEEEGWLGKPLWEMPIKSPDDNKSIDNATQTHLGRLVPQTRILRVNEDKKRILLGSGFMYPKFQEEKNTFHPDVFATVTLNKDGDRMLLSAKPNSALWRELHSLTVRRKGSSASSRGPLCLLNAQEDKSFDIVVNALATNPKQPAEIVDLIESVFNIPSTLCTIEGAAAYASEVAQSVYWKNRLGVAIEEYRIGIDGYWERKLEKAKDKWALKDNLSSVATTHYWTSVEKKLSLLMAHIDSISICSDDAVPTRDAWRKMLFTAACEAYAVACGQETPRQLRAYAKGFQKLKAENDEPETDTTETKEEMNEPAS